MSFASEKDLGVAFPFTGRKRSTTVYGLALLHGMNEMLGVSTRVGSKEWRWGYMPHVVRTVEALANSEEKALVAACRFCVDHVYSSMRFVKHDGTEVGLKEAMEAPKDPTRTFGTQVVEGEIDGLGSWRDVSVQYEGQAWSKDALEKLVSAWATAGRIDRSAVESVKFFNSLDKIDLKNTYFLLLGATSEMGPLDFLLELGANVLAVARPDSKNKKKWERLRKMAKGSRGKLICPTLNGNPGADLLTQTPEIAAWVTSVVPANSQLVVCNYAYMDGGDFVRVTAAMDAITRQVAAKHHTNKLTLATVDTPSHAHVVPNVCKSFSEQYFQSVPTYQRFLNKIGVLKPNCFKTTRNGLLADGLVAMQGPNYALAKLIQRSRSILAHSSGIKVSSTIGPPTATDSVLHAPGVGDALKQMYRFKPFAYYRVHTVKPLLFMLLINDLLNPASKANPNNGEILSFLTENAWDGGVWSGAFLHRSVGKIAFAHHVVEKYATHAAVVAVLVGLVAMRTMIWR